MRGARSEGDSGKMRLAVHAEFPRQIAPPKEDEAVSFSSPPTHGPSFSAIFIPCSNIYTLEYAHLYICKYKYTL